MAKLTTLKAKSAVKDAQAQGDIKALEKEITQANKDLVKLRKDLAASINKTEKAKADARVANAVLTAV